MKKINKIYDNLSKNDVLEAIHRAYKGHNTKTEVKNFQLNEDKYCSEIYNSLKDGSWHKYILYIEMDKRNSNGKDRHIFCPSLITRILQHLLLHILEGYYKKKDNLLALNCKVGCGITAQKKSNSVIKRMKNIFYDKRYLHYGLIIDQRKCYEHITPLLLRKTLKKFTNDKWFVNFAIDICFVNKKLPIGTPTSPFIHNLIMLEFDYWVKGISKDSIRYADDIFIAFETKEEAQQMKWRIKNFWWYKLNIRAKRHTIRIFPLEDTPTYFCGFIYHRNPNKNICDHNKGYVHIRKMTLKKAKKCKKNESWASYFGMMQHSDSYRIMINIEKKMKLSQLTQKIKIERKLDAKNIDIKELIDKKINIYDYDLRFNSQKEANWIKCLIGIEEVVDNEKTGKIIAREFHGNYQGIIQFILLCEKEYGKSNILPIEDVTIENQCGYIFKDSTNKINYIE